VLVGARVVLDDVGMAEDPVSWALVALED